MLKYKGFEQLWQHHIGRSGATLRDVAATTAGKRIAFVHVNTASAGLMG
jgi:hypothetical protein